jgi:hypothetical protein
MSQDDSSLGVAHWGSLRLVRSLVLDLVSVGDTWSGLAAFDVAVDEAANGVANADVIVACDNGVVAHVSLNPDKKPAGPR